MRRELNLTKTTTKILKQIISNAHNLTDANREYPDTTIDDIKLELARRASKRDQIHTKRLIDLNNTLALINQANTLHNRNDLTPDRIRQCNQCEAIHIDDAIKTHFYINTSNPYRRQCKTCLKNNRALAKTKLSEIPF